LVYVAKIPQTKKFAQPPPAARPAEAGFTGHG